MIRELTKIANTIASNLGGKSPKGVTFLTYTVYDSVHNCIAVLNFTDIISQQYSI